MITSAPKLHRPFGFCGSVGTTWKLMDDFSLDTLRLKTESILVLSGEEGKKIPT